MLFTVVSATNALEIANKLVLVLILQWFRETPETIVQGMQNEVPDSCFLHFAGDPSCSRKQLRKLSLRAPLENQKGVTTIESREAGYA